MQSVDDIFNRIISSEGGFVDNPADKGGPTKYGVTLPILTAWRLFRGHGAPTAEDIKALSVDEAKECLEKYFYTDTKIDQLPLPIQPVVVDAAIMSGPNKAIRWLQEVASLAGRNIPLDGKIGDATIQAANIALKANGAAAIISDYIRKRESFYRVIVAHDTSQSIFLNGWINRARSFAVV